MITVVTRHTATGYTTTKSFCGFIYHILEVTYPATHVPMDGVQG